VNKIAALKATARIRALSISLIATEDAGALSVLEFIFFPLAISPDSFGFQFHVAGILASVRKLTFTVAGAATTSIP
jgi:hypothetical protein